MIGRLRGILLEKTPPYLLVDVQGVAYELSASIPTCYRLPEVGQEVSLLTHHVFREDIQLLYGFVQEQERQLFRNLIKVSNVGPKLALTILSGLEPEVFVKCILDKDIPALTRIPGIGKKTAERLQVEMADRLSDWGSNFAAQSQQSLMQPGNNAMGEAISALVSLGYKQQEAIRAINKIYTEGMNSEELIRMALRSMV
jgi:Holliday junction DNA helicase RuvA